MRCVTGIAVFALGLHTEVHTAQILLAHRRDQRQIDLIGKAVRIRGIKRHDLKIIADTRDAVRHMAVVKQILRRIRGDSA